MIERSDGSQRPTASRILPAHSTATDFGHPMTIPPNPTAPALRFIPVSRQRSLAGRYFPWVRWLAIAVFTWAFLGWLNETWIFAFDSPWWLDRYTECALILVFGLWRIRAEKNPYSRRRLIIIVVNVTVLWWWIPALFPFVEPYVGYLGWLPVFPSLHTPGTLTFFLVMVAVFLFGRRIICGFNCPCVGIREVVGFPFRHADHVPRGPRAWSLRRIKWLWFVLYLGAMLAMLRPANAATSAYLGLFALAVGVTYYGSMPLSPWLGNRGYCRFLCPFGATFGLLNKVGPFRIDYDPSGCIQCDRCLRVCDMGIPVWHLGAQSGAIKTAECMGCGRCVSECPTQSLAFHDIRNLLHRSLRQNGDRLRQLAGFNNHANRWQWAAYGLLLGMALALGGYFSSQVGTGNELISQLATLCGLGPAQL
ncbi:MAG: 4Fe-4S binding protein [Magnetococcales bacterium]|nr:4Fe-4S binding protein [Magnetococcales bacterium]